jgi:phage shock protein C
MFCTKCGNSVDPSSRFCPACGAPLNVATTSAPPPPPPTAQLTRSRHNRMIAGICAGFALHYGWDLNLVRIVTALLVLLTGVGALAYLAAWIIIPEAPYSLPAKTA